MSLLPIRPELADVEPYGAPQLAGLIQLNVNENPFPPPTEVADDIAASVRAAAANLNRYPDREFTELRRALAAYLREEAAAPFLTEANLWAANGSNEAMLQLFQAFGGPGREALWCTPAYSMYPEYARDTNTAFRTLPRAAASAGFEIDVAALVRDLRERRPAIVVLTSPNNPTGTAVPDDVLGDVLRVTSEGGEIHSIVVVDEAYAEFRTPGTPSAVRLIADYPHLAVARTMSKAFALAGARLGYLAAPPDLLDAIRRVRLPYHLSAVTQATALAALRHVPALQQQVALIRSERDAMVRFLRETTFGCGRLDVASSHANFVLFGTLRDRHAVWQGLVDRGVLIREVGPEGFLRVSIGTPGENAAFRDALTDVLAQRPSAARVSRRGQAELERR